MNHSHSIIIMQQSKADNSDRMKYFSNRITHNIVIYYRIKISTLIVIAHAIILPAYAITALLSPRGAIDHRSLRGKPTSQPASA